MPAALSPQAGNESTESLSSFVHCPAVVVVYLAERLNALGASHWLRFAGQNYFDPNGVFVSTVLSAPLVFDMFVILVRALIVCCDVLDIPPLPSAVSRAHPLGSNRWQPCCCCTCLSDSAFRTT